VSDNQWAVYEKQFRAHAVLKANRLAWLEEKSLEDIDLFLSSCQRPYVAFSGGKDSLLMLWLTRKLKPDIECIWVDEWDTPDTWNMLDWVEREWGHKVWRVRHQKHPEFFKKFGVQPVLNQATRIDFNLERYGDLPPLGFDGALVGMRRDESKNRDRVLRFRRTQYLETKQILRCAPMANWKLLDAWAYTLSRNLPVHPAYKRQINLDIPLKYARVGGLTIIRLLGLGTGYNHRQIDPIEWGAMIDANPCMQWVSL
jgi:3'-phosphoadenosine 5'-phosphosulfate sulfotransferase (PAPS reductase)/FAD synthetase